MSKVSLLQACPSRRLLIDEPMTMGLIFRPESMDLDLQTMRLCLAG